MQAENRNGSYVTTVDNFTEMFGTEQGLLRGMFGVVDIPIDWNVDTATVLVIDNSLNAYPIDITKAEFEYLSRLVQAEAGGEDDKGKILVVNVIINRLRSKCKDFGNVNTIKEVINQTGQFAPMRNGAFKRAVVTESTRQAVARALEGEDYSEGALFFRRAKDKHGSWHKNNLKLLFVHGGHAFFAP